MKELSLKVKKLWPMLKFFDGQTDRMTDWQTDRVITIGHPPSGGAINIFTIKRNADLVWHCILSIFIYHSRRMITTSTLGAAVAEWLSSWLAEQEDRGSIPSLATWIFRDWLSPASKSRYGWKIAKSMLILKTTNQPTTSTLIGNTLK